MKESPVRCVFAPPITATQLTQSRICQLRLSSSSSQQSCSCNVNLRTIITEAQANRLQLIETVLIIETYIFAKSERWIYWIWCFGVDFLMRGGGGGLVDLFHAKFHTLAAGYRLNMSSPASQTIHFYLSGSRHTPVTNDPRAVLGSRKVVIWLYLNNPSDKKIFCLLIYLMKTVVSTWNVVLSYYLYSYALLFMRVFTVDEHQQFIISWLSFEGHFRRCFYSNWFN